MTVPVLADTSAWVEYDRETGSAQHLRMRALLESDDRLAVTEPVTMEVLAGAQRSRRHDDLRRLMLRCNLLPFDSAADFDAAAAIYRRCRGVGVTPRGLVDCMIAAVALRTGARLLARDVDLDRVAEVVGIERDLG